MVGQFRCRPRRRGRAHPADGAQLLALDDGPGTITLRSIGSPDANEITETGSGYVHVFVPSQNGLGPARTIGDQVRAAFQYYYFTGLSGDDTMRIVNVSPPSQGVIHDGLWHSMIVTLDFEYHTSVATAAA